MLSSLASLARRAASSSIISNHAERRPFNLVKTRKLRSMFLYRLSSFHLPPNISFFGPALCVKGRMGIARICRRGVE
jgi:hypothetical protein